MRKFNVKTVSVESALANVYKYLAGDVSTPFIVVVDDSVEYSNIVNSLYTLPKMHASSFCANYDAFPDIDALCNSISTATQNTLVLGVGESLSLGNSISALGRIKDLNTTAKVVILCRGVRASVENLCDNDNKFNHRRVYFLNYGLSYEIINFSHSLNVPAIEGFKELLSRLENGASGELFVRTSLPLHAIKTVSSAYKAIIHKYPDYVVPQTSLSKNSHWEELLVDDYLEGFGLFHWRSFINYKKNPPENTYLKYVVETAKNEDEYQRRLFSALLDFNVNDTQFLVLYNARKTLLKDVKDSDVAEYVAETKIKGDNRFYYLTDNTRIEKRAIIESMDGFTNIPDAIKDVYPALHEYLYNYSFTGHNGELLTSYFAEYKRLKLINRIPDEFIERVEMLARDGNRPYNRLKTRGEILDNLDKSNETLLYWIDALGVEYLGYIQSKAKTLGLKIKIHVARCDLPSITSFNRDFYEAWPANKKEQTKKLDTVKHEGEDTFNYQRTKTPIHLADELEIIDTVLDWTKAKLAGRNTDKVILISDHGASRLAVINEKECQWEMASKGKHSGRCCPCSEVDVKSEYATKENGYWVLANYDRFKGGRKASVEVHGGATLEEVAIPIVEVMLLDNKIEVTNTTPNTTASFKKKAEIVLFSKNTLKDVSVRVLDQKYSAETIGNNKHKVVFQNITKSGKYTADVFEGDNLIGQVEFNIERESGKINDDFSF